MNSAHHLKLAIQIGQIGLWEWDTGRDRMEWSDLMYDIHGLRRGEFGGTMADYRTLMHPDDAGKPLCGEFRIVRPGGEVRWISGKTETREGMVNGAVVDITAARRAEQELEQFIFHASHDLLEPLRTVTSFAQLMTREPKPEYVGFIVDGTRQMRWLVDGLLALSRVARFNPERVDCSRIVGGDAVVESGGLPEVTGDRAQLTQLFRQLIDNAVKFRAGHVRISAQAADGGFWRFCVQDNGIGFESARARELFVPFRRLHGREFPGAGLGLALCRRIVERHGGRIWAEAAPGEGASVYFTLPGADAAK